MGCEGGEEEGGRYQFAAMMGFPSGLTRFDLGFCRTFAIEDLFFFFWSSRPIIAMLESELVEFTVGASSPQKVSKLFKIQSYSNFLSYQPRDRTHVIRSYPQYTCS